MVLKIISNSVEETLDLGKKIAHILKKGSIVCLFGEFGSGKTVLVKGMCEGLGIRAKDVISPSFVLLCEYKGKIPLYHFDLYRLTHLKEIFDIGYEEYLYDEGITVIEWADRLAECLPKEYLEVKLSIIDVNKRSIELKPHGKLYRDLLIRK